MNDIITIIGIVLMIIGSLIAISTIIYLRWKSYQNKRVVHLKTVSCEIRGESGQEIMNSAPITYKLKIKNNTPVKKSQGVYVFEVSYGQEPLYIVS